MPRLTFWTWAYVDFHIMAGLQAAHIAYELAQWPIVLREGR